MAWVTPTDVNPGDAILASLYNQDVVANTNYLYNIAGPGVKSLLKTDTQSASLATGAATPILKQGNAAGDRFEISHAVQQSSNRVLLIAHVHVIVNSSLHQGAVRFLIDNVSTTTYLGDAAGNRIRVTTAGGGSDDERVMPALPMVGIFSPGDTSAHTYGIEIINQTTITQTNYINRSPTDSNDAINARATTSLILMEVGPTT